MFKGVSPCVPFVLPSLHLPFICFASVGGREMLDDFYGFEIGLMHTAWQ